MWGFTVVNGGEMAYLDWLTTAVFMLFSLAAVLGVVRVVRRLGW